LAATSGKAEAQGAVERFVASTDSFIDLPNLSVPELRAATTALHDFATHALALAERPRRRVKRVEFWRTIRVLVACTLSLGVAGAVATGVTRVMAKKNLAVHATWRASSTAFQCHPEVLECGGAQTRIFFHTMEESSPWLAYDLGRPERISSLAVTNRSDCCAERAVPLIAEASSDGVEYRPLAHTNAAFDTWRPSFPAQTVRFVRLRVLRPSILHLEKIEIFR
jgi:hypothetical protein